MEQINTANLVALIGSIGTFLTAIGFFIRGVKWMKQIMGGQMCTLRSQMLDIYYKYKDSGKIRQYSYENFIKLYESYKAMGGNSFIDKIYEEIREWEIIT